MLRFKNTCHIIYRGTSIGLFAGSIFVINVCGKGAAETLRRIAAVPSQIAQNWAFGVYVAATLAIVLLMLGLSYVLGGRARGNAKNEPFESGVVGPGSGHLRISAKFYLTAVFFVIFDAESALFLYAWCVSAVQDGWAGYIEVCIFVFVLMAGLVYLWRLGALDWAPLARTLRTRSLPTLYRDPASVPETLPKAP